MENKIKTLTIDGVKVVRVMYEGNVYNPRCRFCSCSSVATGKLKNYCSTHGDRSVNEASRECRVGAFADRNPLLYVLLDKELFKKYKRNHGKFITDK